MRVVLAPDSFGDDWSGRDVADLLVDGWRSVATRDELRSLPLSDGGPGFAATVAAGLDGRIQPVATVGPTGTGRTVDVVVAGSTAYVESAQACGLAELRRRGGEVGAATTYGVGQAVGVAAAQPGVDTVVVGLGGSGTNDGGAGLWAGLGAEPAQQLRSGGLLLRTLEAVTPPPTTGVRLIAATDVDNPLLGLHGASAVYGPQKGADVSTVMALDVALEHWADLVEPAVGRSALRDAPGAGAAGGLGFGLLALGAQRVSGVELVIDQVGLREAVDGADLVVTGEGAFDATSLRGKVVSGVARVAQDAGVPVVVAAGQAAVGAREAAAHGIDELWTVAQLVGSPEAAVAAGSDGIRRLGAAIAAAWSS